MRCEHVVGLVDWFQLFSKGFVFPCCVYEARRNIA